MKQFVQSVGFQIVRTHGCRWLFQSLSSMREIGKRCDGSGTDKETPAIVVAWSCIRRELLLIRQRHIYCIHRCKWWEIGLIWFSGHGASPAVGITATTNRGKCGNSVSCIFRDWNEHQRRSQHISTWVPMMVVVSIVLDLHLTIFFHS